MGCRVGETVVGHGVGVCKVRRAVSNTWVPPEGKLCSGRRRHVNRECLVISTAFRGSAFFLYAQCRHSYDTVMSRRCDRRRPRVKDTSFVSAERATGVNVSSTSPTETPNPMPTTSVISTKQMTRPSPYPHLSFGKHAHGRGARRRCQREHIRGNVGQ